jgi:hypothetical protein
MSTLFTLCVVLLVGARARDTLRLRQQEVVLAKLPERDAVAFCDVLRRRVRNARILRTLSLVAALCLIYAWKHGLAGALTSR